jgi:diketogulonate reductase-like aldo/keto reductase
MTLVQCALALALVGFAAAGPVQKKVKLNTGQMMPLINCGGTAPSVKAGDHYSNYTEFLRQGGRGIDTALTYTDDINAQIKAALKAYPEIPRSDIFVTTKVPCCPGTGYCKQAEYNGTIAQDMQKNNELLDLPITDLTLLHHPCDTVAHTIERWLELEAGLAAGLTKAIGVSNFNADLLAQLAADKRTKITPAVNQCNHAIGNHNESHSPKTGGDDKTVAYCKAHGISYSAYSPMEGLSGHDIFKNPTVLAIAKTHNVSGAQIALKWLVQQEISAVTAVHQPAYVAEDIDLWSFGDLSDAEMAKLAAV